MERSRKVRECIAVALEQLRFEESASGGNEAGVQGGADALLRSLVKEEELEKESRNLTVPSWAVVGTRAQGVRSGQALHEEQHGLEQPHPAQQQLCSHSRSHKHRTAAARAAEALSAQRSALEVWTHEQEEEAVARATAALLCPDETRMHLVGKDKGQRASERMQRIDLHRLRTPLADADAGVAGEQGCGADARSAPPLDVQGFCDKYSSGLLAEPALLQQLLQVVLFGYPKP
jgi:hypothetical protein